MKKVEVRIKDGYTGHHHMGKLCEPGDVIEVTPLQAARLHEIGAAEPVPQKSKTRKSSKASKPQEETPTEEITAEGAEETPETS